MIPDEAIADASLVYWRNLEDVGHKAALRKAIEAAAPHMLAEAWEEGEAAGQDNRDSNRGYNIEHKYNPYRS